MALATGAIKSWGIWSTGLAALAWPSEMELTAGDGDRTRDFNLGKVALYLACVAVAPLPQNREFRDSTPTSGAHLTANLTANLGGQCRIRADDDGLGNRCSIP